MGILKSFIRIISEEPKFYIIMTIILAVLLILFTVYNLDQDDTSSTFISSFGPNNSKIFLNITIDTWTKVIIGYALSFMSGILTIYYTFIVPNMLYNKIMHKDVKEIPNSKFIIFMLILMQPIIYIILYSEGFSYSIFQAQFIIFYILGSISLLIPYSYYAFADKKFNSSEIRPTL